MLLLDQFPRNVFRNGPEAYSSDEIAVEVATRAIARGWDRELPREKRIFFLFTM